MKSPHWYEGDNMMKKDEIIYVAEELFSLEKSNYEISTGLLVRYQGNHIFAIQNPDSWKVVGNKKETGLVGIGGKLEKGETVIECVKRESVEEVDSDEEIEDSKTTYLITNKSINRVTINNIKSELRPYFIILLERSEPNRKPFTVVFSYKGNILNTPKPVDVCALLLAKDSVLIHLTNKPQTVKFLKERSAKIIERIKIPDELYLRPYGTLLAYLRLIEHQRPAP